MAFQISPGVNVSEIDLTAIVPAVQTTAGAFAGQFRWGPVEQRVLISNESALVSQFQKPNGTFFKDFFTAANFLAYADTLHLVRVGNSGLVNANANAASILVKSEDDYDANYSSGISGAGDVHNLLCGVNSKCVLSGAIISRIVQQLFHFIFYSIFF